MRRFFKYHFALGLIFSLCTVQHISAQKLFNRDSSFRKMVDVDSTDLLQVQKVAENDSMVSSYFFSTSFEDERGTYIGRFGKRPISMDTIPYFSDAIVEKRLEQIEGQIPLPYNRTIRAFIDYYTIRDRKYARMLLSREQHYFKIFEAALKRHNIPDELKYLAIVESGLNPRAISPAGAAGLWQFMPATGRMFGLEVFDFHDDRMEPYRSTDAACLYLKDLYRQFNDWPLALAAYNCGPGNVRKAIRHSGYKKDFWSIYDHLPRETRSYVPQFVALTYTMNYAKEHHLMAAPIVLSFDIDTVYVSQFVRLSAFGRQIGLCNNEMDLLNPDLRFGFVPDYAKDYPLRVPTGLMPVIVEHWETILDSASREGMTEKDIARLGMKAREYYTLESKYYHVVKSGEALGSIASKYGAGVSQMMKWNNLRSSTIHPGQRLVYYRDGAPQAAQKTISESTAKAAQKIQAPDNRFYTVQPGDTLWLISRKFEGVTVDKLRQLNNLNSNSIKPGMKLKVG